VAADDAHLLVEVAAGEEPGQLEDAAQLQLAPRAARRRRVEGAREGRGLVPEARRRAAHLGQAGPELAELLDAVALQRSHLPLDPSHRVAQGGEERRRLGLRGGPGVELGHVLPQGVALGLGGERAPEKGGAGPEPGDEATEQGAENDADDERRGVHADTVADASDTVRLRHARASASRGGQGRLLDLIR
jgi:hypothetical protein